MAITIKETPASIAIVNAESNLFNVYIDSEARNHLQINGFNPKDCGLTIGLAVGKKGPFIYIYSKKASEKWTSGESVIRGNEQQKPEPVKAPAKDVKKKATVTAARKESETVEEQTLYQDSGSLSENIS
jgi:hypothetical protein